jgi:phosphoribosylglycinamide formyltransferase 1
MFSKQQPQQIDTRIPIAVFASGAGTTLEAIIYKSLEISTKFRVALVVSNNSRCGAMDFADMFFIPKAHISNAVYSTIDEYERALSAVLHQHSIRFIALAGFMKKMPLSIIRQFDKRMINIHPALLPKFGGEGMYGMNVHKAVHGASEKESGTTIHYVADEYDTGAIIVQERVSVPAEMSAEDIARMVQSLERRLYPQIIDELVGNLPTT